MCLDTPFQRAVRGTRRKGEKGRRQARPCGRLCRTLLLSCLLAGGLADLLAQRAAPTGLGLCAPACGHCLAPLFELCVRTVVRHDPSKRDAFTARRFARCSCTSQVRTSATAAAASRADTTFFKVFCSLLYRLRVRVLVRARGTTPATSRGRFNVSLVLALCISLSRDIAA